MSVSTSRPVRTRFAPSPTGLLHVGGVRTALFAWAYAKHHAGEFYLRIEDTDVARNTPEAVRAILEAMTWLSYGWSDFKPDSWQGAGCDAQGIVYQSRRMQRYREVLENLIEQGSAYYCYCTPQELEAERENQLKAGHHPRYSGRCRVHAPQANIGNNAQPVIRFKNPQQGEVSWHDRVKGEIVVVNQELDDLIIARADGSPTYNFCVVVDDMDMQISHVIRGDDHISNTPRQINIFKALGAEPPQYAHLGMVYGSDGKKLSKRHGAVGVMDYYRDGYLPQALLNYLARLGFGHGNDEVFSAQQFCAWFDWSHLSASPAQFDWDKLKWLNAYEIKQSLYGDAPTDAIPHADYRANMLLQLGELLELRDISVDLEDEGQLLYLRDIAELYGRRVQTLGELVDAVIYFYRTPSTDANLLSAYCSAQVRPALGDCFEQLKQVPTDSTSWNEEAIREIIYANMAKYQIKLPQLAMPLRVMLTGNEQSPDIIKVIKLLGQQRTLARLENAIMTLMNRVD